MGFVDASASRVLINAVHLSGSINGYDVATGKALSPVASLLDGGQRFIPGLRMGSLAVTGMFNPAAGDIDATIIATAGVDNGLLWTILPAGLTAGQPAFMCQSDLSSYKLTSALGNAVAVGVDAMPDDGVDHGVLLHALSAETASSNGTGVDNAALSSNGGVANLHVSAYSGLTDITVEVQDSTDDVTYATLGTFTVVTGTTFERITVAGTVNRYVRALWTVTGVGSCTFAVAFARR